MVSRVPRISNGTTGSQKAIWSSFCVGSKIMDPFELETAGFDFDACGLADLDQKRAFDAIIRLFCVMISLERDLPISPSPKEIFLEMRDFLLSNGWSFAEKKACDLLFNARITRDAVGKCSSLSYGDVSEFQDRRESVRERHFVPSINRIDADGSGEAVLSSKELGESAIRLSSTAGSSFRDLTLLLAVDTRLASNIIPFIRSEYIWRKSRMNYSAAYSDYSSNPGYVSIDGRMSGRDGWAVSLDCFESGSYITETCGKLGIPHASTQLLVAYHERYL